MLKSSTPWPLATSTPRNGRVGGAHAFPWLRRPIKCEKGQKEPEDNTCILFPNPRIKAGAPWFKLQSIIEREAAAAVEEDISQTLSWAREVSLAGSAPGPDDVS